MASVNGLSKERMLAIEAGTVTGGTVDGSGNLILTKKDASTSNAGNVRGPKGDTGTNGKNANAGMPWNANTTYVTNDVVGYAGRIWKCVVGNSAQCPPFYLAAWQPLVGADIEGWYQSDPFFSGSNTSDWDTFWRGGTSTVSLTSTSGEFETGQQALKVVLSASSYQHLYETYENLVRGGETLKFAVRAKLTASAAGATINAGLIQAPSTGTPAPFGSGAYSNPTIEGPQTLTTSWQTFVFTIKVANGRPRSRAEVVISQTSDGPSTTVVDHVRISRTSANTDASIAAYVDPIMALRRKISASQNALTGGGLRSVSSVGVSWSQRFITMGVGVSSDIPSGFFDITMPADGVVITAVGSGTISSATVASGKIPLGNWHALYYILPTGSINTTVNANFRIVDWTASFATSIPENWILIAVKNMDDRSAAYTWGDGRSQDYWKDLTLTSSWVRYDNTNYMPPAWRFQDDGQVQLRGRMKSGLSGGSNAFATLPSELGPDAISAGSGSNFMQVSNAGAARVEVTKDGRLIVQSYSGGSNAYVSLDGMSWFPKGT